LLKSKDMIYPELGESGKPNDQQYRKTGCQKVVIAYFALAIAVTFAILSMCSCSTSKHIYYPPMDVNMLPTPMFEEHPIDTIWIVSHGYEHVYYYYDCKRGKYMVLEYWRPHQWDKWQTSVTYKKCKIKKSAYHASTYRSNHSIKTSKPRFKRN